MLRDERLFCVPEIEASHAHLDLRSPFLRVGVHRGRNVASDYALVNRAAPFLHPWSHWRAALHYTRILSALRVLAAPTVTTEIAARASGFRAPSALCHAFAKVGLPSPLALARAARRHGLDGWGDLIAAPPSLFPCH